jgi:hypothetical protein
VQWAGIDGNSLSGEYTSPDLLDNDLNLLK